MEPNTPAPAKTEDNASASSGSWWNIIDVVKKQSENIINIYKEDLQEFTKSIKEDTKEVIKKKDKEISTITGFFGFTASDDNSKEEQESKNDDASNLIVNRYQARLMSLQSDLSTFCTEPTDTQDFEEWKTNSFKISEMTDAISQLLSNNEKMRETHAKLVPVAVSYGQFWERYYYKLHKLNQEEERRKALVQRATTTDTLEEELSWEEEEEPVVEKEEKKEVVGNKDEVEEYFNKLDDTVTDVTPNEESEVTPAKVVTPSKEETSSTSTTLTPPISPKSASDSESQLVNEVKKVEIKEGEKKESLEDDWDEWE